MTDWRQYWLVSKHGCHPVQRMGDHWASQPLRWLRPQPTTNRCAKTEGRRCGLRWVCDLQTGLEKWKPLGIHPVHVFRIYIILYINWTMEGSLLQFRWQESRLTVGGRKTNQPTTWAELCRLGVVLSNSSVVSLFYHVLSDIRGLLWSKIYRMCNDIYPI